MASVFKRGGKNNRNGSDYVRWVDHNGKRQAKSAKTTDKATAERMAGKREADAALRHVDLADKLAAFFDLELRPTKLRRKAK